MAKKTTDSTKKGFFRNWIVRNLIWASVVVIVLLLAAVIGLNIITQHGKEIEVPDFSNMTVAEADALAAAEGMRVEVTDSVFVKRMQKGAVRDQNPPAGSKVKNGRRISLVINALNAKTVQMPDLVGLSMRQALAELQSRGLILGKLIYVEVMDTNKVLRQLQGNREIRPGVNVETDTVIDLVVGLNPDTEAHTYVPNVLGKKYLTAVDAIHKQSLNLKELRFDATVKDYEDSLNAVVYKQDPLSVIPAEEMEGMQEVGITEKTERKDSIVSVLLGTDMTIYLTIDPTKYQTK